MYLSIEHDTNTGRAAILRHEGTPRHEELGRIVDGYICSAGRSQGDGAGRLLYVYCNDEALIDGKNRPHLVNIGHTLRTDAPYFMLDNLVITAVDAAGDTVPMTETEAARVVLTPAPIGPPSLDILPR